MKRDKIITIIEIIIIITLSLILIQNNFHIIKKADIVDEYKMEEEYLNKYELGDIMIYETNSLYNPNTDKSYYKVKIVNNSNSIYSLKGFNIKLMDKNNKELKTLSYDILADIDPFTSINYEYEYDGSYEESSKKYILYK